jgi:hypothetical protein
LGGRGGEVGSQSEGVCVTGVVWTASRELGFLSSSSFSIDQE